MNRTTEQTRHEFETPEPIDLSVDFGKGYVHVVADDVADTVVAIAGRHADEVDVNYAAGRIMVHAPRNRGMFGRDAELSIRISVPAGSQVACKTGSADIMIAGPIGDARIGSGSGDITVDQCDGLAVIETGSGTISMASATNPVQIKSGSGDVTVANAADGSTTISTGSGNIRVGDCEGLVNAKTGSGDMTVDQCSSDIDLASSSGDIEIVLAHEGKINMRSSSGDCRVGIPAGTPVWTDIQTRSGRLHSDLASTGEPSDGQPYVALHITTASGNVTLAERAPATAS